MANCNKLAAGITYNCDFPLVGGGSSRLVLINFDDIESYTVNTDNPQIIEGINLTTSPQARGYAFEGFKSSVAPQIDLAPNPFRSLWNHQIVFYVFDNTPEAKEVIEGIKDGKFVAIHENNYRGETGNAAFELYGKGVGLELTVATAAKNDADSQGAYVLTLSTPEAQKESKLPATVYLTSYAVTKALINSLL